MNNLVLKSLRINGRNIKFKPGVNYIIGMNGSGKTTLFYAIQYLLGLRVELSHYSHFFGNEQASLEVNINGIDYIFARSIDRKDVEVYFQSFKHVFYTNSSKYENFLVDVFQPKYKNPINGKEIKALIRESFLSEESTVENKLASRFNKDLYFLLFGVNTIYSNQIKQYINQLQSEINRKKTTNQEILSYKDNVLLLARRELIDYDILKIENILNDTYISHLSRYNEELDLYEKSKSLLDDINSENEQFLSSAIDRLNKQFQQSLAFLSIFENINIADVINSKLNGYSYGKKTLLSLITRLLVQADFKNNNAIGLVISDSVSELLAEGNVRGLIKNLCIDKGCQYLEFTFSTDIDKNDVIYELGRGSRYA